MAYSTLMPPPPPPPLQAWQIDPESMTISPCEFASLEIPVGDPRFMSCISAAAELEGVQGIDYLRAGQLLGRNPFDVAPYTVQRGGRRLVLWCVEGVTDDDHTSMPGFKVFGRLDKYVGRAILVEYKGGRAVKKAIPREEVVVSWVKAGLAGERGPVCGWCGIGIGPFKKCSKCMVVRYCSRECQVAAWPVHKSVCKR